VRRSELKDDFVEKGPEHTIVPSALSNLKLGTGFGSAPLYEIPPRSLVKKSVCAEVNKSSAQNDKSADALTKVLATYDRDDQLVQGGLVLAESNPSGFGLLADPCSLSKTCVTTNAFESQREAINFVNGRFGGDANARLFQAEGNFKTGSKSSIDDEFSFLVIRARKIKGVPNVPEMKLTQKAEKLLYARPAESYIPMKAFYEECGDQYLHLEAKGIEAYFVFAVKKQFVASNTQTDANASGGLNRVFAPVVSVKGDGTYQKVDEQYQSVGIKHQGIYIRGHWDRPFSHTTSITDMIETLFKEVEKDEAAETIIFGMQSYAHMKLPESLIQNIPIFRK